MFSASYYFILLLCLLNTSFEIAGMSCAKSSKVTGDIQLRAHGLSTNWEGLVLEKGVPTVLAHLGDSHLDANIVDVESDKYVATVRVINPAGFVMGRMEVTGSYSHDHIIEWCPSLFPSYFWMKMNLKK